MNLLGVAVALVGVVLFAAGYARAREPWRRYQELRAREANANRYRAWRGGPATRPGERSGADVAMDRLRREARAWALLGAVGIALVLGGFIAAGR